MATTSRPRYGNYVAMPQVAHECRPNIAVEDETGRTEKWEVGNVGTRLCHTVS